jgi:hypothetical protein
MQQVFIDGNSSDVRQHFQVNRNFSPKNIYFHYFLKKLMTYCANDVKATFEIIQKLYPMFEER